jgi:GxxExxY protein
MEVHSKLGYGFLEKVYENALMVLFEKNEIPAQQQAPVRVYFEGKAVGDYYADILVDNKIILELKAVERIVAAHRTQVLNYPDRHEAPVGHNTEFCKEESRIRTVCHIARS